MYEALSSYFASNGPYFAPCFASNSPNPLAPIPLAPFPLASPRDEFHIAVLEKLVVLKKCALRGRDSGWPVPNHTLFSISGMKSPVLYSTFAPFVGKTFTIGIDFAGAKVLCKIKFHLESFDLDGYGVIEVQVFEYKPDF